MSSARNLGVIFDSNLSFSDHISYISKSCFSHIRDLRRIRSTLDHKTACTIATSLIHSKLDYCNSLYLNINSQQLNRLQLILNSAARAVTKTPKFHHITPHLKSLHWLKIEQRIQYKILSLTYKSLQYNKPSSISDLLTIQPTRSTRSSASCHSPTPFQSLQAQNFWQIFLLSSSCSLECSTTLSSLSLSFFSSPFSALHCLLLNFTSSWKLTFSFIPILLSLSLYWTDPLELWSGLLMSFIVHFTSFILDPFICSTRYDLMFSIVCRNKLTWIHWIHVSFMMHFKSSSYHHIFHFTFSHFISSFVCHMHAVVLMRKKLN